MQIYERALNTWARRKFGDLGIPATANGVFYLENCVGRNHGPTVYLRWSPSNVDRPGMDNSIGECQWVVPDHATLHTVMAEIFDIALVTSDTSPESTENGGEQT